jgi:hypothetical protein
MMRTLKVLEEEEEDVRSFLIEAVNNGALSAKSSRKSSVRAKSSLDKINS